MKLPRILRVALSALVFAVFAFAFTAGVSDGRAAFFDAFFKLQFGPSLMRAATGHAWPAVVALGVILALTLLFGRFYCAFFCPLGILQDFFGWIAPGGAGPVKNMRVLRCAVALVVFALLFAGVAGAFALLDPFSVFGRAASATLTPATHFIQQKWFTLSHLESRVPGGSAMVAGAVGLVVLAALVAWKRRIFCTAACPVGTLLGLVSSMGVFRLKLRGCVKCGRCVGACPAGCIEPETESLDNGRCLRCMNCLAACRAGRVVFTAKSAPAARDPSRRAFLANGLKAAALLAAGFGVLRRRAARAAETPASKPAAAGAILPPGAGSPGRFAALCTGCALCAANCKGRTLRPPGNGVPRPRLVFEKGFCEPECNRCSTICPTGAIRAMTLAEKKRCRVGLVEFDEGLCVAVVQGTHCGACAEHCPTGALHMEDAGSGVPVPQLNESLCVGCGGCEYICPVKPVKAVVVKPVSIQVEAADPGAFFKSGKPAAPQNNNDEWLF